MLAYIFSACALIDPQTQDNNDTDNQRHSLPIDPNEQPREVEITLYFKHEIADFLVPEKRKVLKEGQSIEQLIVEELLKGPQNFERRIVMPPDTGLIDVSRKGDTVFVNLTENFLNDVVLSNIPGKENVAEGERSRVLAEMKRLSVYSIVNSLTYLDGVNQVKLMVGNRQLSYSRMGTELLLEEKSAVDIDSPMLAVRRNKRFNLSPTQSVLYVMDQLKGEPDWESIYVFFSQRTLEGTTLPPIDEFKLLMSTVVGGLIEYEGDPVLEEEITTSKAFVTVKYTLRTGNTRREILEVITLDSELDGIWKIKYPQLLK